MQHKVAPLGIDNAGLEPFQLILDVASAKEAWCEH